MCGCVCISNILTTSLKWCYWKIEEKCCFKIRNLYLVYRVYVICVYGFVFSEHIKKKCRVEYYKCVSHCCVCVVWIIIYVWVEKILSIQHNSTSSCVWVCVSFDHEYYIIWHTRRIVWCAPVYHCVCSVIFSVHGVKIKIEKYATASPKSKFLLFF